MRSSLLQQTLQGLISIGRTTVIEGPPGGGKTSIVHQTAKAMGLPVIEVHMPTMLVEDFGIPFPDAEGFGFGYKMPDWFPYEGKPGTENGGVLLFDDRNQASPDLQKVLANICQARSLHGIPLAPGWAVISTGNRQADRAGANRVLGHLRNRETMIEFETHLDDSTVWMSRNGVRPEVIAFIRFRPALLHAYDPNQEICPTPRSWVEGVSAVLGHVPAEAEHEVIKGAVGEGAATEFMAFLKIFRHLPDPDAILADPKNAKVPTDVATLYALSGAIASRAVRTNLAAVITYISRMPPEFSVLTMMMAARRDPVLAVTKEYTQWAVLHQHLIY